MSGFSVALLAIPQAIAYSFLAGIPLSMGIFSTIFATIIASVFCGNPFLISGPSTSMAILMQGAILQITELYVPSLSVEEKSSFIFLVLAQMGVLIGFLQLLLSFCNISKVLQFVSKPVIFGYFLGVAIAIIVDQSFAIFGIYIPEKDFTILQKIFYFFTHIMEVQAAPFFMGVLSLTILLSLKKTRLPSALVMLFVAVMFKKLLFSFTKAELLTFQQNLIFRFPTFSFPKVELFWLDKLIFPASAIALMSILEVSAVSKTVEGKKETVGVNQEVFGVGLANSFLSFFAGALPSSASISRTTVNFMSGAKSRLSGVFSGLFVAGVFYLGTAWLSLIPMASIAALLIFSSFYFLDKRQVNLCLKATKEDAFVFLITVFSCFVFSLDTAFFIGIGVSIVSYLRKASEPSYVEYVFNRSGHLNTLQVGEDLHRKVRIIGIGGELFFAVVDSLEETLRRMGKDPHTKVIILRMNGVRNMDASMCLAFLRINDYLLSQNKKLMVSGISPSVWKVFSSSSLLEKMGVENFFLADEGRPQLSTWKACLRAQEMVG